VAKNPKLKLTGFPQTAPGGNLGDHSAAAFRLGTVINDTNGNAYRYIKASEAITAGDAVTAVVQAAWDSGILVDGAVTSGTTLHVDAVTTAVAADYYKGKWIRQAAAASKGYGYQIAGHEALAASGEGDIILENSIGESFANNVALEIYDPYLMELVDAGTEMVRGIAPQDITSGNYGWVQIGGFVPSVKVGHSTSAAIVLNEPLVPVSANPGALQGMSGNAEADIMESAVNKLIALDAVGANTTGFIGAQIIGQL